MGMNIKFFYVGHGAMNYLQILDAWGNVVSHFLVDAGSSDDKTDGTVLENNLALVRTEISNHLMAPLVILITHFHDDHYNLLNSLQIPDSSEYWLCVGSLTDEWDILNEPQNPLAMFWNLHPNMNKEILGRLEVPTPFQAPNVPLGDVEVYYLWNNYFTDITEEAIHEVFPHASRGSFHRNRNGTAVAFLCNGKVVVFTGDMTGANFWALLLEDNFRKAIQQLFDGHTVWMTVPHHGSLHTLSEPLQHPLISLDLSTLYYCTECLQAALTEVFPCAHRLYISAGVRDRYNHPNYTAAIAYDRCGLLGSGSDNAFEVYKGLGTIPEPDDVCFEPEDENREAWTWGRLAILESNIFSIAEEPGGFIDLTV